jgi:hypothetical protein
MVFLVELGRRERRVCCKIKLSFLFYSDVGVYLVYLVISGHLYVSTE